MCINLNLSLKVQIKYLLLQFSGIGSIPYVMNCNVTIGTTDITFGREIARKVRGATEGGFPGVQSMAFLHEGNIEIACNIQGLYYETPDKLPPNYKDDLICSFGKYYHVSPKALEDRIRILTGKEQILTIGTSIVGFRPEEAGQIANAALSSGDGNYWKRRQNLRMM